jgi:hypothetical protein
VKTQLYKNKRDVTRDLMSFSIRGDVKVGACSDEERHPITG